MLVEVDKDVDHESMIAQRSDRWRQAIKKPPQSKKPPSDDGGLGISSLTMSYFHTGTRTIIGAESFHCPVRDGKEWYQLAMVIRLNRLLPWTLRSKAAYSGQQLRRVL